MIEYTKVMPEIHRCESIKCSSVSASHFSAYGQENGSTGSISVESLSVCMKTTAI